MTGGCLAALSKLREQMGTLSGGPGDDGPDPLDGAFPEQRAAIETVLPHGSRAAWLCGRRGGKTNGVLRVSLRVMRDNPGCVVPYLALTRTSAERILWSELKQTNERLGLGLRFSEQKLIATDSNGSQITLIGANQSDEVEKLRGQHYPLVNIDEAASFRPGLLEYLITDVLEPALLDDNGRLLLVGTPSAAPVGPFHKATTEPDSGWVVSRWTALQNPHLRDVAERLAELRARRGWTEDHPTYQREYLGRWVRDTDSLVYRITDRNLATLDDLPRPYADWLRSDMRSPPPPGWAHILAADFGVVNANALAIWAYQTTPGAQRTAWLIESRGKSGQLITEAADDVHSWWERYRVQAGVGDAGGLGKPYMELIRSRYGLMIQPADKRGKLAHIDVLGAELTAGSVRVLAERNREYLDQAALLQWEQATVEVEVGGKIRHEERKREDPRFANDICDAVLYGYTRVREYLTPESKPEPDLLGLDRLDRRQESRWLQAQKMATARKGYGMR